jgi:hypothetical protein
MGVEELSEYACLYLLAYIHKLTEQFHSEATSLKLSRPLKMVPQQVACWTSEAMADT